MSSDLRRLAFVALLALLSLDLRAQVSATDPISPTERDALAPSRALLDRGLEVAQRACADCHGMDGLSDRAGKPNLASQRLVFLYRVLQDWRGGQREGSEVHAATTMLNEEALLAAAAYYASLPPPPPAMEANQAPEQTTADPFSGIRDNMKKCVKCHGEDGNSSASGMPNLTAQTPQYFVASMLAYEEGGRDHKLMKRLAGDLDEATLNAMGLFYAVQEPAASGTVGDGNAAAGRALAEAHCEDCHGESGNASGAEMPSLAGQDARYFAKAMEAYREGSRQHQQMAEAVAGLSESDVADLGAYFASQTPVRRDVRMPLTTEEWIGRCERCHGIDGNSTDPRFPMLAGQDPDYLEAALRAYAGRTRANSTMHAMSDPLSDADIVGLARHYAAQYPKGVVYMQIPCEEPPATD